MPLPAIKCLLVPQDLSPSPSRVWCKCNAGIPRVWQAQPLASGPLLVAWHNTKCLTVCGKHEHGVPCCLQVHLFDLRSPRAPLAVLKGHSKAVSYVRWAGPDALVTASTDSTLRLWTASGGRGSSDTGAGGQQQQQEPGVGGATGWDCEEGGWHCSQEFRGHQNSKHFVGLATHGPFIACGSETNEVFMYHQGLAQPSLRCKLSAWDTGSSSSMGGGEAPAAAAAGSAAGAGRGSTPPPATAAAAAPAAGSGKSPFVSALCWKKDSDVLVAANSKGGVWVLSMQ
jgi:E3 ubiquitin-protein ligase RFWD2